VCALGDALAPLAEGVRGLDGELAVSECIHGDRIACLSTLQLLPDMQQLPAHDQDYPAAMYIAHTGFGRGRKIIEL
jgi:hypothetical protein